RRPRRRSLWPCRRSPCHSNRLAADASWSDDQGRSMRMSSYQRLLALGLIAALMFGLLQLPATELPAPDDGRPRLAVMVVFDQLRGDYLDKWQPLFVEGGFKRLQTEGAWFANCHYPYAYTITAPGHASLVTGTYPAKHGIVGNEWYDRTHAETVTSVTPPPEKKRTGLG